MLALLAPGQGAQTPGFLAPWLDLPGVARRLGWYATVTGLDLVRLGTTADEDEIRDTAVCQPLLVAAALAVAPELDACPAVVAGHSVGELAAAALSGALSAEAALVLARERGAAMAAAAAATPTGMSAVLGGDPAAVRDAAAALGLEVANDNGAGQLVVAGALDALAALPAALDGVARVRPLRVAGAFHTAYMAPARDRLAALGMPATDPRVPLLSNADGRLVASGADLAARLVEQVRAPVRWADCTETLADLGVTVAVELPPAGTLTGLLRRALPAVETVALRTPDDLAAVRDEPAGERNAPAWRVVVAPAAGVFEPYDAVHLAAGDPVGVVRGRDAATVTAPYGGRLVEWLAQAGDRVRPGQPLARLHPVGAAG